jgi:ABC-type sugar transport system substrate-binding protein
MKLKIGLEQDHLDDAMKLIQQAFRDQCADLGIELSDIWMATEMDGGSQMNDYQNFLAIADQYDGFFTCLSDASINTDILKKIMQKTNVGFMLAVPFDLDWTDKHFVGITDINAREAGVSSAKAAIKILNGQGKIGTVGYVNGKNGSINTCYQRYIGWDEVFKENPDVPVVQAWYDNPADSKAVVSSLLAANPDIKTLLVDWSYPPGDNALQVAQELGLKPGKDISVVTIDFDNVVTIPMASKGNDSYAAACVAQTWYTAGANLVKMYAKHILQEGKNVKFVASNPAPVTTPMNVKTNFRIIVPETVSAIPMPKEIEALTEQWSLEELGVENIWK